MSSAPVTGVRLADHTTLRLGGPAAAFVVARSEAELVDALSAVAGPVLVLGGGSNLVVADAGFDGTVIKVATTGIEVDAAGSGGDVRLTVAAGQPWDEVVAFAVEQGWAGLETLSGIPGSTGATPIQNVGAYGAEVGQVIDSVRVWDRLLHGFRTFTATECGFGYRWSRFKADPGRHVVVSVTFRLRPSSLAAPIGYAELARALGGAVGEQVPPARVREAVLALRRGKAMVLDPADHDTWSAGSFFTNPIVDPALVPTGAPAYPHAGGQVKTSAAWLIEHAGFAKGYPGAGPVTVSTRHTLALTNRGGAATADLIALAREIRDGVRQRFGIALTPEPVFVGVEW